MGEMYEVKKVKDKATLIDTYRASFRTRFGRLPVININTANEVFAWALEELGFDETERFVKKYLELQDNWLETQGFPIEQFKRSLNRIIAKAGAREPVATSGKGEKIRVMFSCDVCFEKFPLDCYAPELSLRHICPKDSVHN